MHRIAVERLGIALAVLIMAGCHAKSATNNQSQNLSPANVDNSRLLRADEEPGNWMTHGRTYNEQRFSPLNQINDRNVSQLGLAWSVDLNIRRGQEATPIVVDGVLYFSTAWSKVFAVKADTGEQLWSYDPRVPPAWGANACCDVVNRGVAVWRGKVYVGTLDGRLVALDAATGKPVWETLTIDPAYRYTITGAPRIAKGRVLIGNGGAEMGVRGYVSAYDADSGKLAWRFYTVPGDPAKPFESLALEKAASTWSGQWWKLGGGATVWDAVVYDPELNLVFIGTGNGTPWERRARSPQGKDNLFTSSVVALNADTGEYVWHYQEVPGDSWDYDAASPIMLADITLHGAPRKVLFHAPKDGFFYVLDRATGQVISAKPYTPVTWATGIDPAGRPIENIAARYDTTGKAAPLAPGPLGGHSWHSFSYSPATGLVYLPVQETSFLYKAEDNFQAHNLAFNVAIDFVAAGMPQDPRVKKAILDGVKGHLVAWDPVQQKEIWHVDRPCPTNGGTLATAGNLVFQGTAQGNLEAFRADNGQKLWSADTQSGVIAAPISYSVGNDQYIAIVVGWGGVFPLSTGEVALKAGRTQNIPRVVAYKLGGSTALPPLPQFNRPQLHPPKPTATAAVVRKGENLYQNYCSVCHGDVAVSGGVLPDLRYSGALAGQAQFSEVVLGGSLQSFGMISFAKELSLEDAEAIRDYVIFRANQSLANLQSEKR